MTRTTGQKIVARFERRTRDLLTASERAWLVRQIDDAMLDAAFFRLDVSEPSAVARIVRENVKLKQQLAELQG